MALEPSAYLNLLLADDEVLEGLERIASTGVENYEFWTWARDDRDDIVERATEHGLDLVYMTGPVAPMTDPDNHEQAVADVERGIEVATSVDCQRIHPPVGPLQDDIPEADQHDSIVAVLEEVVDTAADAGVELVLEPRNDIDHPGYFLNTTRETYDIIEDVGSSNLKVLFDIYHEQSMRGDLIRNIRENADMIGHVHCADVPTRQEPGTGEVNFENVFRALEEAGYDGYVGCEFYPSGDLETALTEVSELLQRASAD